MRAATVNLYQHDELGDGAKARARDWWLNGFEFHDDFVLADCGEVLRLLGFSIPDNGLSYSGFSSQGDGASFVGAWSAVDCELDKVREEYLSGSEPDKDVSACVEALDAFKAAYPAASAVIRRTSHQYCHKYAVAIEVEFSDDCDEYSETAEKQFEEVTRDLMEWIYQQLSAEYYYQTEQPQVEDAIRANEYEFDANGKRTVLP